MSDSVSGRYVVTVTRPGTVESPFPWVYGADNLGSSDPIPGCWLDPDAPDGRREFRASTLDLARDAATAVVFAVFDRDRVHHTMRSEFFPLAHAAETIGPEGGTIGPLSDGSTITVEPANTTRKDDA